MKYIYLSKIFELSMKYIIINLTLFHFGCQYSAFDLKYPNGPNGTIDNYNSDFKFSIAGTDLKTIQSIVPAKNIASSYIWDRVPNNESHIQMLRACNYYETNEIKPLNSNRWWCWDKTKKKIRQHEAGVEFTDILALHPDWIWLIGNEPHLKSQDNLSPEEYAEFYGWVAKTIAVQMRLNRYQTSPKLVFCQASINPRYCEIAYLHLKEMVAKGYWSDWPENLNAVDTIWALSVHNYIDDRFALTEDNLSAAFKKWKDQMNNFVAWSNTVDNGALEKKALWVTEFGALESFCPDSQELPLKVHRKGGVVCPAMARRNNGHMKDDFVFYGRNENEGIWGLQHKLVEYFLNRTNDPEHNQGDWQAAWWFAHKMGDWDMDGECDMTTWLFGDDTICNKDQNELSRAGETYRDTINCALNGEFCPEF